MNSIAEEVSLRKKDVVNAMSLLATTIPRQTGYIWGNVYAQMQQKTKEYDFFHYHWRRAETCRTQSSRNSILFLS